MSKAVFIYEGQSIIIQCDINKKMKDICINLSNKINIDINSLIFLYGGNLLNTEKKFSEITKENTIKILVFNDVNKIYTKSERTVKNSKLDEIIITNNKINNSLIGLNNQIKNIINNLIYKKDINNINIQLENIILVINKINESIKKINNELIIIKCDKFQNNNLKENKLNENKLLKNEIICTYNKKEYEISLFHDYSDSDYWDYEYKKYYIEGRNNINGNNIEIYINNKKIEFNYKYKSNEKGYIKVKFIFNKLLTSTFCMFKGCSSLESIDLSSFKTTYVNNMYGMFSGCSSLKSIDLSSLNTSNVHNMRCMFYRCSSLKSLDLSSFDTTNVNNMDCIFDGCYSLKKENVIINKSDIKILNQLMIFK